MKIYRLAQKKKKKCKNRASPLCGQKKSLIIGSA